MTETANSAAARKGKGREPQDPPSEQARRGGLKLARIHTTPGVHPYDQVTWERRDVVMTNWRDGSVNFEQRGVEFPDFWSVNAANIVTTKYFRGAVGSPQREWSLKQLVDRVVGMYEKTGREHGYFATDEDAEIFGHELRYALIHQIFSFNSPVWFNVGTASPQQVSACQPYDALVSTPAGLIPIGKLVQDDATGTKVYDAHGVTKVIATKANGTKRVLRLHTKAGHALDVTPDHLVWRSSGGDAGRFVPAGDLKPGHKLQWHQDDSYGEAEIDRIEELGLMEVYDIQTESGEYLSSNLRVHNCFILAVDDTMDSILEWYREEGLIFKGGSGAGVNLSRIRSSKELLSSGGTASGPVSFMRGADASAGTIKSGGATRRAAKMVVLDVDHPDVAEFIQTKAREEEKIRVLRDAGFDMDLGGQDIVSVQYQNANNSVRVSDEFMRAVEEGKEFDLLARRTGEVVERVDARKLLRSMAQAAWECADPGIQYDGTINDWHTCPESGRITASNPCFPADQRVLTDKGLIRIGDLVRRAANEEQFAVYTNDVTSEAHPRDRITATAPTRYMVTGRNEILELRFSDGARLRCTPGHRTWTVNRGWVRAEELTGDDKVVRSFRHAPRPMADNRLPMQAILAVEYERTRTPLQVPSKWDEEFAHYLGWLIGDGCINSGDATAVTVYGSDEDKDVVLPRHHALLTRITGFHSKPSVQSNGTLQLRVNRQAFSQFLYQLGVAEGRAPDKVVPSSVYEAPEDAVIAFLRGLFDADGCVVNQASNETRYVGLGSRSEELLIGVQELLASLGVPSRIYMASAKKEASFRYTRKDDTEATYGSTGPSYDLRITAGAIRDFHRLIGFSLPGKQAKLTKIVEKTSFYRVNRTVRMISRQSKGFETTYNLTEPRNHSYIVSGTVVANCSEYVHLDNSSCNLASINLLKFLRDDDTFDTERFRKITELIITAMDISITFADFPTEKITEVTRAYRQLGIGYANLGALLMATGHAYDSEGGRAIAAAITSLMTGAAYKTSAELAAVVGPYDGYARNAKPHQRVIRKHASASENIRTVGTMDRDILDLASQTWQECIELGEKNGYRSAQSSLLAPTGTIGLMLDCDTTGIEPDLALVKFKKLVGGGSMQIVNQTVPRALKNLGYQHEQVEAITEYIAEHGHVVNAPGLRPEHYEVFDCAMGERAISPMGHVRMMAAVQPFLSGAISKCVTGETLIPSAEGLIRIGSLHRDEEEDNFREEHLVISSLDGDRKTDAFYYGGTRPVRRVRVRSGHTITGTYPHRLLVAGLGGLEWKTLAEIEKGDSVALQYGAELWATMPVSLRDVKVSASYGRQKQVRLPEEMSTELAFLLGAYAAEGNTTRSNWTIRITNSVPEVLERVRLAWQELFGVQARIVAQQGRCPEVAVSSQAIVEFFEALGCGSRASEKRIPDAVLRSPREMVLAFLQGLALDAYVTTAASKWAICLDSPKLLDDLQAIMTNLGVLHGRITKHNKKYGKDYDEVYSCGLQGQLMASLVPFLEPHKAARAAEFLRLDYSSGTADVVPGITGRELFEMIPLASGRGNGGSWRNQFTYLRDSRTQHVTRRSLERVSTLPGVDLPGWLRQVIKGNLHFSPVDLVTDMGEAEVYDLSVPDTHAFVANGVMNHNTVNMPESATVEDVEHIYFEGWKLGLKALAIYRDNCKVGQPLSDARKKPAEAEKTAAPAGASQPHQHRPVRKRLPRQRPATVTRFSVAGAEGYMTASSYPDDGIGEVFLKLGKQGSTLAGVMDAFSMAISVGLQYGIPLDSYVAKFTNMRFEPAGLTDDPDIRIASSVMDYIFRRLALDHLPYEDRAALGILSATERAAEVAGHEPAGLSDEVDPEELAQSAAVEQPINPERTAPPPPVQAPVSPGTTGSSAPTTATPHSSTELIEAQQGRTADAPLCLTCGTKMRPAGSCYVCEGCGSTSGCS